MKLPFKDENYILRSSSEIIILIVIMLSMRTIMMMIIIKKTFKSLLLIVLTGSFFVVSIQSLLDSMLCVHNTEEILTTNLTPQPPVPDSQMDIAKVCDRLM